MTALIRRKKPAAANSRAPHIDYLLLVVVGALLAIGWLMVYSTTFDLGYREYDDPGYFITRQVVWTLAGLAVMAGVARLNYQVLHRVSIPLLVVGGSLLIAVLFFGQVVFGAQRSFFGGSVQPSEIVKLITIIYIADWLSSKGERIRDVSYGLIPFSVLIGGIAFLIVSQPDFGTAIVLVTVAGIMFFLAGADVKQLLLGLLISSATLLLLLSNWEYAQQRVDEYFAGWNNPDQASHQVYQALIAIGSGGALGVGPGASHQKFGFLPVPHTDSIFAVLGEEFGLVGGLMVLALFGVLGYCGIRIALNAPDAFGALMAVGVTCWIVLEALINVAVITGTLPLSGLPLPFISYGGSSVLTLMAAVGLLQSIARASRKGLTRSALMDSGRRNGRPRLSRLLGR